MDINEHNQFYDGSVHYEYVNDMMYPIYAPAREDFNEKLSPSGTWLPQHFAHQYEPHQFVYYQPAPQHFVPAQQPFVFLPPPPYVLPAPAYSPQPSFEPDPQPHRICCSCGCNQMCTQAEIAEHEMQARVAEDRELAIIGRALESLRFTMNLPQCDFVRQLQLVCTPSETWMHEAEATNDDNVTFIIETLESMRITLNLPLCHFSKQLRKAVWRYERQDCHEKHTSHMALHS